jgi:hypothetical protein
MTSTPRSPYQEETSSVPALVAALKALGSYSGSGEPNELAAETERLGEDRHRLLLANSLLGAAQMEAILAEPLADGEGAHHAALDAQMTTAGVLEPGSDVPPVEKLGGFLQWQAARVSLPLRLAAQDPSTGPVPLAAAHAAEGLVRMLGIIAAGQGPSVEAVEASMEELAQARECLLTAVANLDVFAEMIGSLRAILGE